MYNIFLSIAIILISTSIGGALSKKINMPQVLGALVAGVVIGPSLLGIVKYNADLKLLSDLGVVMLMFIAGLQTDLEELKKAGLSSLLIATGGVIVPLIFGTLTAFAFFNNFYENLFIGVILTATSVTISVQTLNELGKLNTKAGVNILGAAVIDDVIGLLIVSFVLSLAQAAKGSGSISSTLILVSVKVTLFCVGSLALIAFLPGLIDKYTTKKGKHQSLVVFALALALIFAFLAESLGIAAITGAYVFGLILSSVTHNEFIGKELESISVNFLSPVFFASVGLVTNFRNVNANIIVLTLVMLIVAILGKIVGCGLVAKLYGMESKESVQIGVGMISRGEVAIITTNLGLQNGIISDKLFIPTLLVVVTTTLITPIFLKLAFNEKRAELKNESSVTD